MRPSLSLAGIWLRGSAPSPLGFPVSRWISMDRHAVVITPVAHWVLIARGTAYSTRFPFIPSGGGLPLPSARSAPHWSFRGLLDVHACYGLSARRAAMRPVYLEGSDGFVTSTAAPIATGRSDPVAGWGLHPLKINTFPRRTPGLTPRSHPKLFRLVPLRNARPEELADKARELIERLG